MSVKFKGAVCDCLRDAAPDSVFRIVLSSNIIFKAKVDGVLDDGARLIDEDGAVFLVPFSAIIAIRDVTDNPAFRWKARP